MKRRCLLGVGLATAGLLLMGHTPYGQWSVYRQRHLLILTNRIDGSYPLGKRISEVLATYLPDSESRVARAPNLLRVASLLSTKQMDVALVRTDDAISLLRGVGPFTEHGPMALRSIIALENYLLVCRDDFPNAHAYQVARTLTLHRDRFTEALKPMAEKAMVPAHPGALAYYRGDPPPMRDPPLSDGNDHRHE